MKITNAAIDYDMSLTSIIYPQAIYGTYRRIKNYAILVLFTIYFGGSWLRWDRGSSLPGQAILMDLPHRKAYFFGIEIWPQEAYYITGILILAAMGLFFVTSLFGRIWCGYACPHTVFVDIFRYVEHFFQGDRNERIKLDAQPMTMEKFRKKVATHIAWLSLGFSFAFGWVCYFYDAPSLCHDLLRANINTNSTLWLLSITTLTYLFAGYIRERMCMDMCPYGRFQSAMVDQNTYVVSYHDWRGEPRGNYDPHNPNLGDCIDCHKCVVVCPMGIDIRNGLQMACIGCGLCIDACNTVMSKLSRPSNLIGYDSIVTTQAKSGGTFVNSRFFYIKTILFAALFSLVSSLMLYSLAHKATYTVSIARERGPLFAVIPDGSIRNTYTIKILNREHTPRTFVLTIEGLDQAQLFVQDYVEYKRGLTFFLKAEQEGEYKVFVKIPGNSVRQHKYRIGLAITPQDGSPMVKYTVFAAPGP